MVFNVNGFNLKNIQIDIIKSKGINIVKKANLKSYIKGSIINFQINGIDNFNEYNFEFKLLALELFIISFSFLSILLCFSICT